MSTPERSTSERKPAQRDSGSAPHQPPPSDAPGAQAQARPDDASPLPGDAANQGSPAAPVMKQFAKTDAESGGRR